MRETPHRGARSRPARCRLPRTRGSADNTCAPHQPQPHHRCARRHVAALDRAQRVVAPAHRGAPRPRLGGMATATRATALLVRNRVTHTIHAYAHDPRADGFGEEAARALGVPEERLFKTLVAVVDAKLACAVVPV